MYVMNVDLLWKVTGNMFHWYLCYLEMLKVEIKVT